MADEVLLVKCPTCQKDTEYSPKNAYRRFCSEICKLIDLGAWENDVYSIEVAPETEEELMQIINLKLAQAEDEESE